MSGYSNRIIHISFPELSDDPDDPIWVSVRNPRLMAPQELQPREVPVDADGKPVDEALAKVAMYELYAKLIVGWRVYDATKIAVDPETGQELDMERLPSPATPDLVERLPMAIINRLATELKEALNPPSDSVSPTTTM